MENCTKIKIYANYIFKFMNLKEQLYFFRFLFIVGIVIIDALSAQAETLPAGSKPRIAVLDLKAENVEEKTSKTITNMIRADLVNCGLFSVIERTQIDKILNEHGLNQTGIIDPKSAIHAGRLLSAHKVLIGEISEMDSSLVIAVRVVDVEKGVAEYAERIVREKNERIDATVTKLSQKLIDRIQRSYANSKIIPSLPKMLTISYSYFLPLNSEIKDYYPYYQGASLGYVHPLGRYVSITGNIAFLIAQNSEVSSTTWLNSYSLGCRLTYPLIEWFYPYLGLSLNGSWLHETQDNETANFSGYGFNTSAGLIFPIDHYGIFVEAVYQFGKVLDKDTTDISGFMAIVGILIKI